MLNVNLYKQVVEIIDGSEELLEMNYVVACIQKAVYEGKTCCYIALSFEMIERLRKGGFTVESLTYTNQVSGWR